MIRIVIELDDSGVVQVDGDIGNQVAALGLLEVAKECVQRFHRQQAERLVQPARVLPPNGAKSS